MQESLQLSREQQSLTQSPAKMNLVATNASTYDSRQEGMKEATEATVSNPEVGDSNRWAVHQAYLAGLVGNNAVVCE